MTLACQKDSYLKSINTKIKSIVPSQHTIQVNGEKKKINCFHVTLEDSILFPEGGGQPDDHGKINDLPVLAVVRKGAEAVHIMESVEFTEGQEVLVEVDWQRRWYHMQQHSAQHLISALAEKIFNWNTTSWNLGSNMSSIELDTKQISEDQLRQLERESNDRIREALPMYPILYEDANDPEIKKAKCRGLPADHVGPVRVMVIESVDINLCCGTHVSNLAHLQAIKLLDTEKGKKDKTILTFIAGDRLLQYVANLHQKEKKLTTLLKGGTEEHIELLEKTQSALKIALKNSTTLLRDVAKCEAQLFKQLQTKPNYFFFHKKEGSHEFMNLLSNEIADENVLIFLTVGEEKGPGLFLLTGKPETVNQLASRILELLEGKGACNNGRLQGKANKMQERTNVEKLILEYLNS